jgi:hypothetical protein
MIYLRPKCALEESKYLSYRHLPAHSPVQCEEASSRFAGISQQILFWVRR